jgi:hypothetical protein
MAGSFGRESQWKSGKPYDHYYIKRAQCPSELGCLRVEPSRCSNPAGGDHIS